MAKYIPSIALSLFDRAEKSAQKGETISVVLLCMASLEGFINEYIEIGKMCTETHNQSVSDSKSPINKHKFITVIHPFHPSEKELLNELTTLEKKRVPIIHKVNAIRSKFNGDNWNSGIQPYQNLHVLIQIRNALVHPRSLFVEYGDIQIPKFLKPFQQQKKIQYFKTITPRMSWVELIETKEFANWCLNAFQEFMKELLQIMIEKKKIPDYSNSQFDLEFTQFYLQAYNFK